MSAKISRPSVNALLEPYQQRWLRDESPLKVWEKSRRVGGDYAEACHAVHARMFGGRRRPLWYASADESAAVEFMVYVRDWASRFGAAVAIAEGKEVIDGKSLLRLSAEIPLPPPHGGVSRIVAMTSNPNRFRSKGGDVTLSEFAHHEHAADVYKAAGPVTARGGVLSLISTHNGEHSLFNRIIEGARRVAAGEGKPGDMPYSVHRTTIYDAVREGLVERINLVEGSAWTREGWLAAEKAKTQASDWGEEYECVPSLRGSAFYAWDLLRAPGVVDETAPIPTASVEQWFDDIARRVDELAAERLFAGVDVGRSRDLTVFWVAGTRGGALHPAGILVLDNVPYDAQREIGVQLMSRSHGKRKARVTRLCADATGIGAANGEHWRSRFGHRVEAITVTNAFKADVYPELRQAMEERLFKLPDDEATLADFASVRRDVTSGGQTRYVGERSPDGHADRTCAAALCQHAFKARRAQPRGVPLPVGGGGWL